MTIETAPPPVRALILCPEIRNEPQVRLAQARLEEAVGLARAISLDIAGSHIVPVREINPATLIGRGKIEQISEEIQAHEIALVIVDHSLTPAQQRELERAWKIKVIDRTGLILEIFGERARTSEGQLQVELAALDYQRSRLVKSWTHLERQRGGFGFLGGPGESQLEIDRRLIDRRITRIRQDLGAVRANRRVQREARVDPVIALVGYTNAGKSTLFNRLSQAGVMAENMLFATLDPTIRKINLPSGWPALISDTVGFISDLPTELVAAFSATLEEVLEADIILHVRDCAHDDTEAQKQDVLAVLESLGIARDDSRIIEVLNKADLLTDPLPSSRGYPVSALNGTGVEGLLAEIDRHLSTDRSIVDVDIDLADGRALAECYQNGRVLERVDEDGWAHLRVERRIGR